jgi:hypothetical protein
VALAKPVAPEVPGNQAVQESPVVQLVPENQVVPELELVQVAVALRTKLVTTAHHRGLVPAPRVAD